MHDSSSTGQKALGALIRRSPLYGILAGRAHCRAIIIAFGAGQWPLAAGGELFQRRRPRAFND